MSYSLGSYTLALDQGDPPGKELIGGKAWSIAQMAAMGLNVPPAFVITTSACNDFFQSGGLPPGLINELSAGIRWLEERTERNFGGDRRPLLVSVRSGAPVSMPGMMDTILNLGIDDVTEAALATETGDQSFARDTRRRFLTLYGEIVLKAAVHLDPGKSPAQWIADIRQVSGKQVPEHPSEQLVEAVRAVFESWNSRRARRYREHHGIDDNLGTAVTVQAMVFGNLDERSGTGVLFTRNPLTGASHPYGEFLARAQGEDVVSGRVTPQPLAAMQSVASEALVELLDAARLLESKHGDVQDIEFTLEQGRLYLLQSRAAKRSPEAAVRIAIDMVQEGIIDEAAGIDRVSPEQIRLLLSPRLVGSAPEELLVAKGQGACPGIGIGLAVTDADEAERRASAGEAVVLVRPTTSPADVHGMIAAAAVITEQGGSTSHAAVVGRALGRPCVIGCGVGTSARLEGRIVTVDGRTGRVYEGVLPVDEPDEAANDALVVLRQWAERYAPLKILGSSETPQAGLLDLDAVPGGTDIGRTREILAAHPGIRGAKGAVLASSEGVLAAVAAGLEFIVADRPLPTLIAAAQAGRSLKRMRLL